MKHKKTVSKCVGTNYFDDNIEASDGEDILGSNSFNNECVVYVKNQEQEKDENNGQPIKCKLCIMHFKNMSA